MNLLATPWSEALARASLVVGRRSLRIPTLCVAASLFSIGLGNAMLSSRVAESEALQRTTARERAALDRAVAGTHVRETRLRVDLTVARRIASVERNAKDTVDLIARVVNRTPISVWFSALTVDRTHLAIHGNADSLVAISAMLRSSSMVLPERRARIDSIIRASDVSDPILSFTLELHRIAAGTPKVFDARS